MNKQSTLRIFAGAILVALGLTGVKIESIEAAIRQLQLGDGGNAPINAPLTGTVMQESVLTAFDGAAQDNFGAAISVDGLTAVAGAPRAQIGPNEGQGAAYVYALTREGWEAQQKLTAVDGTTEDFFGSAVAISGDTLVVGAPAVAHLETGAAYVFKRTGTTWSQQQKLFANDGEIGDGFGKAVAIHGDTVVVGAVGDNIGSNLGQGSVYVFKRNGSTWSLQQKLTASDGAAQDSFGWSVSISGETLAVGAYQADISAKSGQGAAYVFQRTGTVWMQQRKIVAGDGASLDNFGISVSLSGNSLAVGARGDDISGRRNQGSAYVFTRVNSTWSLQKKLIASDGGMDESFGRSVALDGDLLTVSAYLTDNGIIGDLGSAYIFTRSGGLWTQKEKLIGGTDADWEAFGKSVAVSGATVMVSAEEEDVNTLLNQGAVHAFRLPSCAATVIAPGSLPYAVTGASYAQWITTSGGVGPYQYALAGGALPPGFSLSRNGFLSGVSPTPGTYAFTVNAIDLGGLCVGTRAYTLTVLTPCLQLTIDPPELSIGALGQPYSETLSGIGGIEPYRFAVKGALPAGLTLSTSGQISGTPTQLGYFPFTLIISDGRGCSSSWAYSITIMDAEIGIAGSAARRKR